MKSIDELTFPEDVRYAEDHEWARQSNGNIFIGISDFAQDQLGDIVYVELPRIDTVFHKGETFGTVESVKAVSELYMPISGVIKTANSELEAAPELVNHSPYDKGWMITVKPSDPDELNLLMDKSAYLAMLSGLK
ncbi:MAG: glycine cleavage system protein GcvH [Thermodesulfobacteriota bacterium]